MLRNMPQPRVRELGDTASVCLVGAVEILLMMGNEFFYFTPNTVDSKLETMPSSSPLSTAYVKNKIMNFSWIHENEGGRMLIPFIE